MKRRIEIDAARGAMLSWMTLTHLPTFLTPLVNEPFGYVTASEGFVFLSALFTGCIYMRLLKRGGVRAMTSKLYLRTLRLYQYHVVLLVAAFVVAAHFALSGHHQGLYNLLDFYFAAGPARAVADALLLVYRPPLLDIIPLYLTFLIFSPLILMAAEKIGWKYIFGGSFAMWILAQFGLREAFYGFAAQHFHLRVPLNELGAFNPWAWQFMWVIGMWCGACWAKENLPIENWAHRAWKPAAAVAVVLLVLRYAELSGLNYGSWSILFDKWHLGVFHLIDFAAITILMVRFQSVLKPFAVRPLVLLGQSSLQVFCAHFVFCLLGIGLMGSADRIFGPAQIVLIAGTFASLLVVAKVFARQELSSSSPHAPERSATRSATAEYSEAN